MSPGEFIIPFIWRSGASDTSGAELPNNNNLVITADREALYSLIFYNLRFILTISGKNFEPVLRSLLFIIVINPGHIFLLFIYVPIVELPVWKNFSVTVGE